MRLMKRQIMDYSGKTLQTKQNAWLRVRDEGDRVTVTFKKTVEGELHGSQEVEITVNSYQKTVTMFERLGLQCQSYQESKRETWRLGDCEIVLDEWPWLEPFLEIEGPSQAAIQAMAVKLELDWTKAIFGSVLSVYQQQYPAIKNAGLISDISEVTFAAPRPTWFTEH